MLVFEFVSELHCSLYEIDLSECTLFGGRDIVVDPKYEIEASDWEFLHIERAKCSAKPVLHTDEGFSVLSLDNGELGLISPDGEAVGFMFGSRVYVSNDFRGNGLSAALIAGQVILNDGVANINGEIGYSNSGYYSHIAALRCLNEMKMVA